MRRITTAGTWMKGDGQTMTLSCEGDNFFDAEAARRQTEAVRQAARDVDNSPSILSDIQRAVMRGASSVDVREDLMTPMTKRKLERLGFEVKHEPDYQYFSEDDYYPIWGKRFRKTPKVTYKYVVSW